MLRIALSIGLLSLTACELNLGPGLAEALCEGPCPAIGSHVSGEIFVGSVPAVLGESVIYLFDPADVETPVAEDRPSGGTYSFAFETTTDPSVCTHLAKVVLWNGEESPLKPLVPAPRDRCLGPSQRGARFDLPSYAPLDAPFVLTGTVYVDGIAAIADQALALIPIRAVDWPYRGVYTDPLGSFRFETTDPGHWLWFCITNGVRISVRLADGRVQETKLERLGPDDIYAWDSITGSECGDERKLPDVRFGQ